MGPSPTVSSWRWLLSYNHPSAGDLSSQNTPDEELEIERNYVLGDKGPIAVLVSFPAERHSLSHTVLGPSALSFKLICLRKVHLLSWSQRWQWLNLSRLQQCAIDINKYSCGITLIASRWAFQAYGNTGAETDIGEERVCRGAEHRSRSLMPSRLSWSKVGCIEALGLDLGSDPTFDSC